MATTSGRIRALSMSRQKGTPKTNVPEAELKAGFGVVGDAHAGVGHRQVSLLAARIDPDACETRARAVSPGDFGGEYHR